MYTRLKLLNRIDIVNITMVKTEALSLLRNTSSIHRFPFDSMLSERLSRVPSINPRRIAGIGGRVRIRLYLFIWIVEKFSTRKQVSTRLDGKIGVF